MASGVTVGTTFVGSASTDTITTAAAHGLLVGDRVRLVAGTGALPTGLAAATDYYVKTVPTTTTLTLAATRNGALIDITADGGTAHLLKAMGPLEESVSFFDILPEGPTAPIRRICEKRIEIARRHQMDVDRILPILR